MLHDNPINSWYINFDTTFWYNLIGTISCRNEMDNAQPLIRMKNIFVMKEKGIQTIWQLDHWKTKLITKRYDATLLIATWIKVLMSLLLATGERYAHFFKSKLSVVS